VTWTLVLKTNGATSSKPNSFPGGVSSSPERIPAHMPPSVPADQLYYWTGTWRQGEAEGLADLAAGRARDFTDPTEAIRYLVSADDD
jgi:hypothetical protein